MKKILSKLAVIILLFTAVVPVSVSADAADITAGDDAISIVFSHDMHSHLEQFGKIRTVIKEQRRQNQQTFVLDAGDFSMGTPYQTIYKKEASELRMMGAVGYDAAVLGNHEFDYRSAGLSEMLTAAAASGDRIPKLVISNIDWEKTLSESALREDGEKLRAALKACGAQRYAVLEKGDARIAVFGIFGKEAASYAPESGTYFCDPVETARDIVEEIKAHEKVDLVICLSHSGTHEDPAKSEDEILAEQVDGIDLIISGHSHTKLQEPIVIGNTVIASAGQYNENLGTVTFAEKNGAYVLDQYRIRPLDKTVKEDASTVRKAEAFRELVDKSYFSAFDLSWDQVLTENRTDFTDIDTFGLEQGEDPLGSLIADSYKYGVRKAEGKDSVPVDVAVAPAGVIRGSFAKGNVTAADAFNALSLGTGKDGIAGYPLVSVYLTGKELCLAAEIDASVSEIMQPARLYFGGLNYTYNPNRLILNRAYDITMTDEKGNAFKPEPDRLYRVVADLYSAQMLGTVNSMSYGLLSVVPKDKNGSAIRDFEDYIIYNKDGSELKEWHALAGYLDSMSAGDIEEKYGAPEGRKVNEESWNPFRLLKKPNKFFWMITAAVVLVLALTALLIVLLLKLFRRLRYGKQGLRKKDMMFRRRRRKVPGIKRKRRKR